MESCGTKKWVTVPFLIVIVSPLSLFFYKTNRAAIKLCYSYSFIQCPKSKSSGSRYYTTDTIKQCGRIQFLRLLSRYEFHRIVEKDNGDYRTKHFKYWHQLAYMMFAHTRQENSLRDIGIALNAHANKTYHIGIPQRPKSTFADANECRDCRIYEEFAKSLMQQISIYGASNVTFIPRLYLFSLLALQIPRPSGPLRTRILTI